MNKEIKIVIGEDDEGHAVLIKKNLKAAGLLNDVIHLKDGEEVYNFFFKKGAGPVRNDIDAYLLLLDIRMPKRDGVEVLRALKEDKELKKIPVIMVTTTDDPREIQTCHDIGCNSYVTKPIIYEDFVNAIRQLGLFLQIVQVPHL